MSNEYMFGLGPKHLPRRVSRIAKKHGAVLVNYTDPGCRCGYGCTSGECPACQRHWFAGANRGEPFDSALARAVLDEIGDNQKS